MRRFSNGTKQGYQQCAYGNKHGANKGVSRKRFAENDGGAYRVEDETGRLEGRENGKGEGGDLDGTADDVCHDEHEHAQLSKSQYKDSHTQ